MPRHSRRDRHTHERSPQAATRGDPLLACELPSRRTVPFLGRPSKSTHDHAELGSQWSPWSAREDSCLMFCKDLSHEAQGRETCETTQTRRQDARRDHARRAIDARRACFRLCASCLRRKRKPIPRSPLDGAAPAIVNGSARSFALSMRHAYARRGEVPSRRTSIDGTARARCSSRLLAFLGCAYQRTSRSPRGERAPRIRRHTECFPLRCSWTCTRHERKFDERLAFTPFRAVQQDELTTILWDESR